MPFRAVLCVGQFDLERRDASSRPGENVEVMLET